VCCWPCQSDFLFFIFRKKMKISNGVDSVVKKIGKKTRKKLEVKLGDIRRTSDLKRFRVLLVPWFVLYYQ